MPDTAAYYGNRAAALMMLKKFRDALRDIEHALELNPAFVKVEREQLHSVPRPPPPLP